MPQLAVSPLAPREFFVDFPTAVEDRQPNDGDFQRRKRHSDADRTPSFRVRLAKKRSRGILINAKGEEHRKSDMV